jgi:hypothetical protein
VKDKRKRTRDEGKEDKRRRKGGRETDEKGQ